MIFNNSVSGMSVKIGHVINGQKTYIVGAPRSTEVGQVLLLQPEGQEYLVVKLTLNGEQFGSGFGYDIALGDFNNDGSVTVSIIRCLLLPPPKKEVMFLVRSVCLFVCLSVGLLANL